jgi:hypothetical protein
MALCTYTAFISVNCHMCWQTRSDMYIHLYKHREAISNVTVTNVSDCGPNITPKHMHTHTTNLDLEIPKHRRTTFIYIVKKNKYFCKLFNHTNLKITYRTNNSIEQNLKKKKTQITSKYCANDVYKLTCLDCEAA